MTIKNRDLPKLLRAIAGGTQAKENGHDIIFNAAADEIEALRAVNVTLMRGGIVTEDKKGRTRG